MTGFNVNCKDCNYCIEENYLVGGCWVKSHYCILLADRVSTYNNIDCEAYENKYE